MEMILQRISPQSSLGSFLSSVLVHLFIFGAIMGALQLNPSTPVVEEEYVDLGYQTFDEPPPPAETPRQVVSAKDPVAPVDTKPVETAPTQELQDEKGIVSGTQEAAKNDQVASQNQGDALATPYYKIKPKYPKAALVSGTEGWVLMNVDVNENGEVENIRIVDGEEKNLFQSEARRAVSQWKYRPFVDGSGKPFKKINHQVRVDFKLAESTASM